MERTLQKKSDEQNPETAHQPGSPGFLQSEGETGEYAGMPLYLSSGPWGSGSGESSSATPLMLQRQVEDEEEEELLQASASELTFFQVKPVSGFSDEDVIQLSGEERDSYLTAEFFNLDGVRTVQAHMDLRFHRTINYSTRGLRAGDTARHRLNALADNYEQAWDQYAVVIRAARQEARHQEQWTNICVGIGAGILIGLGAAFVFPTAAAGWFSLAAGEVVGVIGSSAGQAALGAVVSSGVADTLRPAGTELEPEGMSPAVLRMEIWQNISEMYRSALLLSEASRNLHMLSNAAEYLIGEIRVHIAGGEAHMSEDSVLDMVVELVGADHDMTRFDDSLRDSLEGVDRLQNAADSLNPDEYPREDMERDIWILWMSELSDPSVLDLDEIEDYLHGSINILGEGSELGVDFGDWWTSSEDEQNARRAAESHASDIRLRFQRIQGDME